MATNQGLGALFVHYRLAALTELGRIVNLRYNATAFQALALFVIN